MPPPNCLHDSTLTVVVDASFLINLTSSGMAREVLRALPNTVVVVEEVLLELEQGRDKGRESARLTDELIAEGFVQKVTLSDVARDYFTVLVVGGGADTLDDGEAATIAHAADIGGTPVVDEVKGRRLCAAKHPKTVTSCSLDIFSHPEVIAALGDGLAETVFMALTVGRMHVMPYYIDWVVDLIGKERTVGCRSLPQSVRKS